MISKKEYLELAHAGYNRIPLVQEVLADLDTPLSIYLKLAINHLAICWNRWWVASVLVAIHLSVCRATLI